MVKTKLHSFTDTLIKNKNKTKQNKKKKQRKKNKHVRLPHAHAAHDDRYKVKRKEAKHKTEDFIISSVIVANACLIVE